MANRFPLTLNTVDKQIEELPSGTNLDLTGSSIIGASNITATGTVDVGALTVNGQNITATFSGDYNDLSNKPTIPTAVSQLDNDAGFLTAQSDSQTLGLVGATLSISGGNSVSLASILPTEVSELINDVGYISNLATVSVGELSDVDIDTIIPTQGDALVWDNLNQEFRPTGLDIPVNIGDLSNVSVAGAIDGQALIYDDETSSWVPGNVAAEVSVTDISGSVFADDSTLLVDGVNGKIVGPIDTTSLTVDTLNITGIGATEINSATTIDFIAEDNFLIKSTSGTITLNGPVTFTSALRAASFTTTERNELTPANGDIIYNTTDNKFQGYENGAWANLI